MKSRPNTDASASKIPAQNPIKRFKRRLGLISLVDGSAEEIAKVNLS